MATEQRRSGFATERNTADDVTSNDSQSEPKSKSLILAYILWLCGGIGGVHRYYLFGDIEQTKMYMYSFAYFGSGWIADLFLLPYLHYQANEGLKWQHEHKQPPVFFRNYIDPYTMHLWFWFPFGLHNIYLDRNRRHSGMYYFFYFFSLGYFGNGWLVDLFRMPILVKESNEYLRRKQEGEDYERICCEADYDVIDLRLCTLAGFFGVHHFYLRRATWGFAYLATFGLYGFGWLYDLLWWPRMSKLLEEANRDRRNAIKDWDDLFLVTGDFQRLEAYLLALPPFGIFGLYHFYLRRTHMGYLYLCTAGLLGIGWLVDLFRMEKLVDEARRRRQEELSRKDPNEVAGPMPLKQIANWTTQAAGVVGATERIIAWN